MSILPNAVAGRYFGCQVCQRGILVQKKIFRMSGPVVAIGFILLIPSILGILFSALLFFGVVAAGGTAASAARRAAIASMRRNGVPGPIVSAVAAGENSRAERLMDAWPESFEMNGRVIETSGLPEYQRSWVHAAERQLGAGTIASGLGTLIGGGFAIVLGVASFVGGLLGWLLVMRKRVLQCSLCRAVVNAS